MKETEKPSCEGIELVNLIGCKKEITMKEKDGGLDSSKIEHVEKAKKSIDLDKILVEEIKFGWFQLRTVALTSLAVVFSGFAASDFVFTTARINTRCLIPECESIDQPTEFSPTWILNAVPTSGSSIDNCQRFANSSANNFDNATCPSSLFDSATVVDCEKFVYETTDTVVYTFALACQEWQRSFIGSARTVGTLASLPITGFVSDRWGRSTALGLNAFLRAILGLGRSWVNTYVGFTALQFLEAALGTGVFTCAYILVMEMVEPKMHAIFGASINSFFSIGCVISGLLAWLLRDWRYLTRALYGPMLVTCFSLCFVPESVRWYMSKGRFREAETVLKSAARLNGTRLSDKSLEALRESVEEENRKKSLDKETADESWLIVQVFRHKQILLRCIISPFWWISFTFVYYGLSINVVNISGNSFLNYMAVSAMEIPGYWTSMFLLEKLGRKPVLICGFWICAACQATYIFMPDNHFVLSLTVYLIGKFSIAMVSATLYVYTAELYPTRNRHSLLGYSSMVGRIGSILASFTPALGASTFNDLPFVLFGSFALLAGCLVSITPETRGVKYPDTMEEASNIGKKRDLSKYGGRDNK